MKYICFRVTTQSIGSLRFYDGDGNENVIPKYNFSFV